MRLYFLLAVLLTLSSWAHAGSSAERLHSIRIESFTACSYLILFLNPHQGGAEPLYAERYKAAFRKLQTLVSSEHETVMGEALAGMRYKTAELEGKFDLDPMMFPTWLNPILTAQAKLDSEAAKQYAVAHPADAKTLLVQQLDLDLSRLLLVYQARTFGSLNVSAMDGVENPMQHLDNRINQEFEGLSKLLPDQSVERGKLRRIYGYIRPSLLDNQRGSIPNGVAYYMEQIRSELRAL
ncbi:hypothetical protein LJY18_16630 [Pseudomonas sp. MMS21-TM103]|uniref:hypothetical protein n=1 Tax=Pseudomonas sp. MMS21 TM103 TaxID=2886506 RepID=UPI001EE037A3|nr:hypothetical protein [Pseudomonas sp. MMS21 TM103]MCG4454909.1 hypothetical protein [Pseudomonas sp. MMS21 TM103]